MSQTECNANYELKRRDHGFVQFRVFREVSAQREGHDEQSSLSADRLRERQSKSGESQNRKQATSGK